MSEELSHHPDSSDDPLDALLTRTRAGMIAKLASAYPVEADFAAIAGEPPPSRHRGR